MSGKITLTFIIVFFFKIVEATEEKGGMPQLNPESFSSQVFWLFFFFTLLLLVNHFYFLPKLKKIRSERDETIENYIKEAKKLNESIENIIQRIDGDLKLAKDNYDKEIKSSYDKSKTIYEAEIKKITEKYENKKVKLGEELIKSKKNILAKIHKYALPLSDQIYEKIMGEKKNGKIEEFKKALGE